MSGALNDHEIITNIEERFDHLEATVGEVDGRVESLEEVVQALQSALASLRSGQLGQLQSIDLGVEKKSTGPKWADDAGPSPVNPPDDDDDPLGTWDAVVVGEGAGGNQQENKSEDRGPQLRSAMRGKGGARKSISAAKVSLIDEAILDTQTKEYYTFGESTWDLFIFIGTGALGPMGSFQTFILAVVNVLMQGVFVGIALFNFTNPDITTDTVMETLRWRRSSGHSLSEYDDVSKASLVARVCSLDKSLHISGIQMNMIENIRKYIKPDATGAATFFTGQVLCLVALICWYLMVAKEVSHALALHRGVVSVPRGPTSILTRENPFTQVTHYRLNYVSRRRKVMSSILLIYRLLAAGLLIYVGTFFLVYTVNVTELILNAVALGIILDIDDLLFDALATTPGRHLVHQLDALPMPSFPRFRGADLKSITMSILIPSLTVLIYFTMLAPIVQTLNDVSTAMCGGQQEFVWTLDKRKVVLLSATAGGGWDNLTDSIQYQAVDEAENLPDVNNINASNYGVWVSDVSMLSDAAVLTLEQTVDAYNPLCQDLGNKEPVLNYLRNALGNQSIMSCQDAKPYCNSLTKMPEWSLDDGMGFATRMFCSDTCGCNNPGGEIIYIEGCPYGSGRPCWSSGTFKDFQEAALCVEKTPDELRNFTPWISWVNAIQAFGQANAGDSLNGQPEALLLAQAMWDHGCDFGANLSAQNVSWGSCESWNTAYDWNWKTPSLFCPLTCNCAKDSGGDTCPTPSKRSCDQLQDCLFANNQYYCEGDVPVIEGFLSLDVDNPAVLLPNTAELTLGLQTLIADLAGNSVEPWMVVPSTNLPGRRLEGARRLMIVQIAFQIFQILDSMDETSIQQAMMSHESSEMTSSLVAIMDQQGVDTSSWGLDVSSVSFRGSMGPDSPGDFPDSGIGDSSSGSSGDGSGDGDGSSSGSGSGASSGTGSSTTTGTGSGTDSSEGSGTGAGTGSSSGTSTGSSSGSTGSSTGSGSSTTNSGTGTTGSSTGSGSTGSGSGSSTGGSGTSTGTGTGSSTGSSSGSSTGGSGTSTGSSTGSSIRSSTGSSGTGSSGTGTGSSSTGSTGAGTGTDSGT